MRAHKLLAPRLTVLSVLTVGALTLAAVIVGQLVFGHLGALAGYLLAMFAAVALSPVRMPGGTRRRVGRLAHRRHRPRG